MTTPPPRDRDSRGRARNARPRDGLGRPLPRGSAGVERVPEDLMLPPLESLAEAQRLIDLGRPFHAHEVLEGTWKAAPASERDLWQGLAQLAVGLTHQARGNHTGAVTVLRRSAGRLARYDEQPYDINIAALVAYARRTADELESGHRISADVPPLRRNGQSQARQDTTAGRRLPPVSH